MRSMSPNRATKTHSLILIPKPHSSLFAFLCASLLIFSNAHGFDSKSDSVDKDPQVNLDQLVKKVDELYRNEYSQAKMEMTIVTPDWKRTLVMDTWSQGMDKTLVKIKKPKKEAGIGTLKLDQQMWNFFPKINRTIKVPPSMLMGAWMGSDFTNDDLVRSESLADDYQSSLTTLDNKYLVKLIPLADTITVWGRIEVDIDKKTLLPSEQRFYNERDKLMRTMTFSEIKDINGRLLPTLMELIPHNKTGHKTVVRYLEISFPNSLPTNLFSLQQLKRR